MDGFTAQLNGTVEEMRLDLAELKRLNFIDQESTRAVFIDFTVYLSNRYVCIYVCVYIYIYIYMICSVVFDVCVRAFLYVCMDRIIYVYS